MTTFSLLSENDLNMIRSAMDRERPLVVERQYRDLVSVKIVIQPAPPVHGGKMLASCYGEARSWVYMQHCHSAEEVRRWLKGVEDQWLNKK